MACGLSIGHERKPNKRASRPLVPKRGQGQTNRRWPGQAGMGHGPSYGSGPGKVYMAFCFSAFPLRIQNRNGRHKIGTARPIYREGISLHGVPWPLFIWGVWLLFISLFLRCGWPLFISLFPRCGWPLFISLFPRRAATRKEGSGGPPTRPPNKQEEDNICCSTVLSITFPSHTTGHQ